MWWRWPIPARRWTASAGGERFLFALVDLQMPEMTGQEFLAHLRESEPELARAAADEERA